jgi:hypothetical protein
LLIHICLKLRDLFLPSLLGNHLLLGQPSGFQAHLLKFQLPPMVRYAVQYPRLTLSQWRHSSGDVFACSEPVNVSAIVHRLSPYS